MSASKINLIATDTISNIDAVSYSTISQVNDVDLPAGFSTSFSLDLNGSSQYATLGDLSSTVLEPTQSSINTSGFTFTAWIYIDTLSSGEYIYNIGSSGTNNYYGFKVVVNNNGALVFHVMGLNGSTAGAGSNNRNTCRTANSAIAAGQWYHIAIVVPAGSMGTTQDRDEWRIYKNGSVVNPSTYVKSGNQNVVLSYNGSSSLGAWTRASVGNYFDGELNNLAVFSTGLDANNIAAIYNSGAPIDLSSNSGNYTQSGNLIAWWRFNEGSGTSYTDSTGNGFTGTGVGTPTYSSNVPT